jgi:hypothetical protein
MNLRLEGHIEDLGVELIMIDEFQHLVERKQEGTAKIAYEVADWVKLRLDEIKCPILLAGTENAAVALNANGQLAGRLMENTRLGPLPWATDDDRLAFRVVMHKFEKQLPFERGSRLGDPETAALIHCATDGRMGEVARLIVIAAIIVVEEGRAAIGMNDLAVAYDRFALGPFDDLGPTEGLNLPAVNPFRSGPHGLAAAE